MTDFNRTQWTDKEFLRDYLEDSDIYLPYRAEFLEMAKFIFERFGESPDTCSICDLGCGDGKFFELFLSSYPNADAFAVDGSGEMIAAARDRLKKFNNVKFIQKSFQELVDDGLSTEDFHFVFSSLAIHHLSLNEKADLYRYIYSVLRQGGCFIHYDVIAPRNETLEKLYLDSWREWIRKFPDKQRSESLINIPEKYKLNPDNKPDSLDSQMSVMKKIGFDDVDCYLKHGLFALFGGRKMR